LEKGALMSKPWEKYAAQKSEQPEASEGPWAKYQAASAPAPQESKGIAEAALEGLNTAVRAADSYLGAPVRKTAGALLDGKGVIDSLGEGYKQFGENPDLAPTKTDLRKKAGIDLGDSTLKGTAVGNVIERAIESNPVMMGPTGWIAKKLLTETSPNDVVEFGIEAGADLTNIIPAGTLVKQGVKGGAKAVSSAAKLAANAADATFKGAGKVGKRFIEGAFGVPEEAIEHYLKRHPDLKNKVGAREMAEELAGKLDEGLKPARDQLAAAEAAVSSAKAKRSEDLAELMVKRQEAKDALRLSEQQALGEAASRLSGRVQQLDKEVKAGSSAAFDILDKEGVRVPTRKLILDMDMGAKALAERAVTREQKLVADLVKEYADNLRSAYPKEIPGGEAKRILQSLDREMSQLAPGEIGRLSKEDQVIGTLRRRIDEPLKASPAYAGQMAKVAPDTRLLIQAKDLASESSAARALQAASRATGKDQMALIQAIEAKYGDKLLESVSRSNLPEYAKLKGLVHRYRAAKKGQSVKDAERMLGSAKEKLGDVSRMSNHGVAGLTDQISSYVRASQPGAKQTELLEQAGKLSGIDMPDALKDIKTISAFEKGYNRGSANTNVWAAVIGGLAGSVMGPVGGAMGVAGGAAFGRMIVDNFGPKFGRIVLDAVPTLKQMNSAEWIRSLDVPNDVKAKLATDLAAYRNITQGTRAASVGSKAAGTAVNAKRVADENAKGEDRWAQQGASKLGIEDPAVASRLMQSPQGKRLLIEASDQPAGSKRLQAILKQIQGMENHHGNELSTDASSKVSGRERQPSSRR
jgi:hypothetical protein